MRFCLKLKVKLALLFLAVLFLTGCTLIPIEGQPWYGKYRLKITNQTAVRQRFYSSDRNLTAIDVFLAPSYQLRMLRKPKPLFLELNPASKKLVARRSLVKRQVLLNLTEDNGKLVRKVALPLKQVNEATFYRFQFKPLPNSKQRWYQFSLSVRGEKAPVLAWVAQRRQYPGYTLFINGQAFPGAILKFRPYIKSDFSMLLHSVGGRLLDDKLFLVAYASIIFLIGALTVLSWRWTREDKGKELQLKKLTVK